MLTGKLLKEQLADLEREYYDFVVKHLGQWEVWAEASGRVANREEVKDDEIPEAFHMELKMMRAVLEMEDLGRFDWNNPKLKQIFKELPQMPFYKFFGEMVAKIALRLADLANVKTFLEIGAGKANLTGIMLRQMRGNDKPIPIVATDAQSVILENIEKLKSDYPEVDLKTVIWNIMESPSDELFEKMTSPTLLYERYTLNYANCKAVENLAKAADILVLGDWFNHTGKLYGYDEVFKKIGAIPLFYKDVKPILDNCFPNQYIFDQRVIDAIRLPNIALIIAWK
jgi:hypothetical protein